MIMSDIDVKKNFRFISIFRVGFIVYQKYFWEFFMIWLQICGFWDVYWWKCIRENFFLLV